MRNGGMRNGKSNKRLWIKIKSQNLRLFLAYTGRKYDYSKASGLTDYNTDRIEIGMLYRLKAY